MSPTYAIELWSRQGVFLADISKYVDSMRYSLERNEAEQLEMVIDLNAYEAFCASIGIGPTSMLSPYATDIKIRRNGEYLFGTHVAYVQADLGEIDAKLQIRAFGYLNLLIDRYVTKTYVDVESVDIAWDLIETTQAQTNGDMGMTQGSEQTTTVTRDREYVRQNVKDAIVNLTKLESNTFDFEFTPDREFNTYAMIGSDRTNDLQFIYPGKIKEVVVPRDGVALFNKIYGLGAGFGEDGLRSTQGDNDSQLNYGVHEKIVTWNSVTLQETLDEHTAGRVLAVKDLLEIPQMTASGIDFDLNDFGIGDVVTVRIDNHPFLATVNGHYRIEKIDVEMDENQAETVKLSFDSQTVPEDM